jgi:hypothetical protein
MDGFFLSNQRYRGSFRYPIFLFLIEFSILVNRIMIYIQLNGVLILNGLVQSNSFHNQNFSFGGSFYLISEIIMVEKLHSNNLKSLLEFQQSIGPLDQSRMEPQNKVTNPLVSLQRRQYNCRKYHDTVRHTGGSIWICLTWKSQVHLMQLCTKRLPVLDRDMIVRSTIQKFYLYLCGHCMLLLWNKKLTVSKASPLHNANGLRAVMNIQNDSV